MAKKRNKRSNTLYFQNQRKRAPFRRSIFVHTSQEQDRATKRLNLMIRAIISLVIIGAIVLFMFFIFGYLIPFLQKELSEATTAQGTSIESTVYEPTPKYDDKGIRIYENNITLYLINTSNPAEEDETPETELVGDIEVSTYMAASLELLIEEAKNDDILLEFSKGYVSYEEQEALYEAEVQRLMTEDGESNVMARKKAQETEPMAGQSDFQTGMCVLLKYDQETFIGSITYQWLNSNMANYGFVFRYPSGKETETGLNENYCVLRYVGTDNAKSMRSLSMCLEEYVDYLNNQQS